MIQCYHTSNKKFTEKAVVANSNCKYNKSLENILCSTVLYWHFRQYNLSSEFVNTMQDNHLQKPISVLTLV